MGNIFKLTQARSANGQTPSFRTSTPENKFLLRDAMKKSKHPYKILKHELDPDLTVRILC